MIHNPVVEIPSEPEVTSFDAREILAGLRDSVDFHRPTLSSARKHTLYDAIYRVTYDSDSRHRIRAIAAKGFLPYYEDQYVKMYVQVFGFQRQGIIPVRVDCMTISEALISNMLAATDHIYWAIGSLSSDVLRMLHSKHGNTPFNIENVLRLLNTYAGKILSLEHDILNDKDLMMIVGMSSHFAHGVRFDVPVPDRSYRNNPHWTDFFEHFKEQRERVSSVCIQLHNLYSAPELCELVDRLESVPH